MGQFDSALTSDAFNENPYPVYNEMRAAAPVYWSDAWGCWMLTRYQDITWTLQDYQTFTSLGRLTATMELPEPLWEKVEPLVRHYSQGLINVDPPDHTRMRKLVHMAFTPRAIRKMETYVQDIVERLIDGQIERGAMDVIWDFSYPLPVTVIATMMGIPVQDHAKFKAWSGEIVGFMATPKPSPEVLLKSQDALLAMQQYFRDIYAKRRQEPEDDLITALVQAELEGDKLSEEEMVSSCVTILIGGHETTTYLIANGMYALLKHPAEFRRLRDNLDLAESATEEFLRYEGPFQRNRRIATRQVQIDGATIEKGQLIVQFLGAANRDPAQFPDPDRLDITRSPNKHLAFGYGPHFCLGAPLARLEAPVAFRGLLRRLKNMRLAHDNLEWNSALFRGLKSLPIEFEPA
ncbi:MAG: cytochrome P450 [Chloroflexi bacterium]|nr:cytochrome P450 [Chloroflexota bacterium]